MTELKITSQLHLHIRRPNWGCLGTS